VIEWDNVKLNKKRMKKILRFKLSLFATNPNHAGDFQIISQSLISEGGIANG
jgi:hypothetical protein